MWNTQALCSIQFCPALDRYQLLFHQDLCRCRQTTAFRAGSIGNTPVVKAGKRDASVTRALCLSVLSTNQAPATTHLATFCMGKLPGDVSLTVHNNGILNRFALLYLVVFMLDQPDIKHLSGLMAPYRCKGQRQRLDRGALGTYSLEKSHPVTVYMKNCWLC